MDSIPGMVFLRSLVAGHSALSLQPWIYGVNMMGLWKESRLVGQAFIEASGGSGIEP